jgi:hypothetical protein
MRQLPSGQRPGAAQWPREQTAQLAAQQAAYLWQIGERWVEMTSKVYFHWRVPSQGTLLPWVAVEALEVPWGEASPLLKRTRIAWARKAE